MLLYACPGGKAAPHVHPCGIAARALDDAGHRYDFKQVKGGRMMFWTWPTRARDRAEIQRLSGQRAVPILVLDDGEVLSGSGAIVRWARATPAPSAATATAD